MKNLCLKEKGKKGDLTDILVFMVTIFVFGIVLFIFAYVVPQISSGLKDSGINNSAEGNSAIDSMTDFGTITLQRGFFILFAGLIIATMVSSFLVRTHPIFLFLYIIFLGISIFVSTYLSNAYDTMTTKAIFAETLASQTLINFVMNNMMKIMLAVGALSMIIVFAKFSSREGKI